jgi:IS30 family transposase
MSVHTVRAARPCLLPDFNPPADAMKLQSLTGDRGVEMANHAAFTIATDVQV